MWSTQELDKEAFSMPQFPLFFRNLHWLPRTCFMKSQLSCLTHSPTSSSILDQQQKVGPLFTVPHSAPAPSQYRSCRRSPAHLPITVKILTLWSHTLSFTSSLVVQPWISRVPILHTSQVASVPNLATLSPPWLLGDISVVSTQPRVKHEGGDWVNFLPSWSESCKNKPVPALIIHETIRKLSR